MYFVCALDIFYERCNNDNKQLCAADLNPNKASYAFLGYFLSEYLVFREKKQVMDQIGMQYELERKGELLMQQSAIVQSASNGRGANNIKEIRTARRLEKSDRGQDFAANKSLFTTLDTSVSGCVSDDAPTPSDKYTDSATSLSEAQLQAFLRNFNSESEDH